MARAPRVYEKVLGRAILRRRARRSPLILGAEPPRVEHRYSRVDSCRYATFETGTYGESAFPAYARRQPHPPAPAAAAPTIDPCLGSSGFARLESDVPIGWRPIQAPPSFSMDGGPVHSRDKE